MQPHSNLFLDLIPIFPKVWLKIHPNIGWLDLSFSVSVEDLSCFPTLCSHMLLKSLVSNFNIINEWKFKVLYLLGCISLQHRLSKKTLLILIACESSCINCVLLALFLSLGSWVKKLVVKFASIFMCLFFN